MERRVALTAACTSSVCLAVGTVSFAAVGGASILGFGGSDAPQAANVDPLVVKRFQTIDDIVVVLTTADPSSVVGSIEMAATDVTQGATDLPTQLQRPGNRPGSGVPASTGGAPANDGDGQADQPGATPTVPSDGPVSGTTSPRPTGTLPSAPSAAQPSPTPTNTPTTAPATNSPSSAVPTTATPPTNAPVTTAPATTASPPTTVRPPGVPADWPANKPIPPLPANCIKPQLEDNGVWNCEH